MLDIVFRAYKEYIARCAKYCRRRFGMEHRKSILHQLACTCETMRIIDTYYNNNNNTIYNQLRSEIHGFLHSQLFIYIILCKN